MRQYLIVAFCLCSFVASAQKGYVLNGTVKGLKDGEKLFLLYQDEDKQIVDSTVAKAGRFQFKGALAYPVNTSLVRGKNPLTARREQGTKVDFIRFYLEPTTVTLQAKDSVKNGVITGSRIHEEHQALRAMLKPNDDQLAALGRAFDALPEEKKKDKSIYDSLAAREMQLFKESYAVHVAFAQKYPNSYLSVISLAHAAAEEGLTAQVAAAYEQLAPGLKKSPLGQRIPIRLASVDKTQIGKHAPDFTQNDTAGKPVSLSDFKGKYVLLDFWASWCGPCRQENPNVVKAYSQYKDRGFTVLGVSLDMPGQRAAWLKAIEKDELPWTHVSDLKGWQNDAAQVYGIRSVPANFLIDPSGKILARDLRGEALQEELAKIYAKQ